MSRRRIAIRDTPLTVGQTVELSEAKAHYLVDVLRLENEAPIEVFDGAGGAFDAVLILGETPSVRLESRREVANESPCRVVLFQAIAKGDRFEWSLEKATELGVSRIVPIETARTVVRIKPAKAESKRERWQRICEAAARQSGRAVVPEVDGARSLAEAAKSESFETEVVLDPTAAASLTDSVPREATEVAIWIGPEGGFTDTELERLAERAQRVRFGPRVLRSETAGVAAVAAVQLLTGGLE